MTSKKQKNTLKRIAIENTLAHKTEGLANMAAVSNKNNPYIKAFQLEAFTDRMEQFNQSADARAQTFSKIKGLLKAGKQNNQHKLTPHSTDKILTRMSHLFENAANQEDLFNEISDEVVSSTKQPSDSSSSSSSDEEEEAEAYYDLTFDQRCGYSYPSAMKSKDQNTSKDSSEDRLLSLLETCEPATDELV